MANNRVHLADSVVLPVTAGKPTLSEINAVKGSNTDTILYYTGDDSAGSGATYVYWVDNAGALTLIEQPGGDANTYSGTFVVADWSAPAGGYRTITISAATHGLASVGEVEVQEGAAAPFTNVELDSVSVGATQAVTLTVVDGAEFDGRYSITAR